MVAGGVLFLGTKPQTYGELLKQSFTNEFLKDGGAYRIRTCDPHNAIVVLYQLS